MSEWYIIIGGVLVVLFPFYIYVLGRCWAAGKFSIINNKVKTFLKEKPHGEKERK